MPALCGCHVSAFESVEDGAKAHGINVDASGG